MTLALLLKAVERDYNGCYGNDYNADDDSYQEACVTTVVVITTCCVISDWLGTLHGTWATLEILVWLKDFSFFYKIVLNYCAFFNFCLSITLRIMHQESKWSNHCTIDRTVKANKSLVNIKLAEIARSCLGSKIGKIVNWLEAYAVDTTFICVDCSFLDVWRRKSVPWARLRFAFKASSLHCYSVLAILVW